MELDGECPTDRVTLYVAGEKGTVSFPVDVWTLSVCCVSETAEDTIAFSFMSVSCAPVSVGVLVKYCCLVVLFFCGKEGGEDEICG